MREHEALGLRGERDLRRLLRGRMAGVAGAIALFVAERCLVNQEIGALRGVDRRGTGTRIAGERDDAARASGSHEAIGRQLSAISQLDGLTLGKFAPKWTFRDSSCFRFLDVKAPTPNMLLKDIAERRATAVFGGKRAD